MDGVCGWVLGKGLLLNASVPAGFYEDSIGSSECVGKMQFGPEGNTNDQCCSKQIEVNVELWMWDVDGQDGTGQVIPEEVS